jgi:hypothetical protein
MNFPPTSPPATQFAPRNALPPQNRVHSRGRRIDVPRGGKMDGSVVREKIAKPGVRNSNFFGIDFETIIAAAARRQKWIDPSQSVNLFLATPAMLGASARSNFNEPTTPPYDSSSDHNIPQEFSRTDFFRFRGKTLLTRHFSPRQKGNPRRHGSHPRAQNLHSRGKIDLQHRRHAKRRRMRSLPVRSGDTPVVILQERG